TDASTNLHNFKMGKADVVWIKSQLNGKADKEDVAETKEILKSNTILIRETGDRIEVLRNEKDDTKRIAIEAEGRAFQAARNSYVKDLNKDVRKINADIRKGLLAIIGFLVVAGALAVWNWSAINSRSDESMRKSTEAKADVMAESAERDKKMIEIKKEVKEEFENLKKMIRNLSDKLTGHQERTKGKRRR
ncbi:unnamed protein product, partial [marine sediment metagenome]